MYFSSKRRKLVEEIKCLNASIFVRIVLEELRGTNRFNFPSAGCVRNQIEAEKLRDYINNPWSESAVVYEGLYFPRHNWPEVDFILSNLGRGYIFYFICDGCERRCKFLYQPTEEDQPLCRICHYLTYRQPTKRERRMSWMTRKAFLSEEERNLVMEATRNNPTIDLPWRQKKMYN